MKILQLTVHFYPNVGGVETHLSDLAYGLESRGHKVTVLAYRPLVTQKPWSIYEKKENLEIFRIPWFPGLFYKLVKIPLLEFLYLFPALFFVLPFLLIIKRPNVIHAHGLIAGFVGVFWGKIFGIRTVVSTHSIYHFPKKGAYRNFVIWIFFKADKELTLAEQSRKEVISLGTKKDKVIKFTYWVDLEKFKPIKNAKEKVGWKGRFVVLFVGRLVEEKGVEILLDSLKTWDKNVYLVIVGDGPLAGRVKSQSSKFKNVMYLGRIEQGDLPKYYSAADVVLVPSTHEEGFGRVILESLACGTPVIAANRGAIPEAMDITVGKLIEVNKGNISKAVEYYCKNPNKLKKLSKNARKLANLRYSHRNILNIITNYR